MKRIILLLICLVIIPFGAHAGKLYRWIDAQGKVHYGDLPPVGATQITLIKSPADAGPVEDMPYETRLAHQNFPVTLYVADNCAEPCDQARSFLNKRGIPFSEKKLVTQEDINVFKALSGFDSVPALLVGRGFLKGFQANQWNKELDIAGYPKTAPFRLPAALPVPVILPASAPAATTKDAPVKPATP
jgi:hypothetical protein